MHRLAGVIVAPGRAGQGQDALRDAHEDSGALQDKIHGYKYQAKLAAGGNHSYQKALEDLRGAQESWRTACFEAIASTGEGGPDVTAWMAIQRRADEIRGRIPAAFDDFDHDHFKETFA